MKRAFVAAAIILAAVTPAAWGQAVTAYSGGSEFNMYYGDSSGDVVGFRFTVSVPIQVTALGVWNQDTNIGGAGLQSDHQVGIWDAAETLLASVTVTPAGTVNGHWTYASITPVGLSPGQTYTIGALYTATDNDNYLSGTTTLATASEVTWVQSVYPASGSLGFVFPTLNSTSNGRFGPNFLFTVNGVEPEIDVDPLSLASSQLAGTITQHTLTINNTGAAPLDWDIFEELTAASPVVPADSLPPPIDTSTVLAEEAAGVEYTAGGKPLPASQIARMRARQTLLSTGLLLVPDSTNDRIMALDPVTGNVIDPDFVPSTPIVGTGIHAILNAAGDRILLSDQIGDVVHQFDLGGNYIGIFAPAGGANTAILDNIRGMALRPNGNLLVTVASGSNTNAVAEFDTSGNFLGNFVANAAGGLGSPWHPFMRSGDWLVSGSAGTTGILRYDLSGAFLDVFAAISTFPEQIAGAANGNVLVANFSPSGNQGVLEYTSTGTFVGRYAPAGLSGYRGVYELPDGTILTTTGSGVHQIDRDGNLIENKITGISGRFIEFVTISYVCTDLSNVPWLSTAPSSGTTGAGLSTDVTVSLDSTGLAPDVYTANLCIFSNDPDPGPGNGTDLVVIPITLEVTAPSSATVTVEVGPGGGGSASGGGVYTIGETATVAASPAFGWVFLHWLVNGTEIPANPYIFEVTEDITLTAVFARQQIEAIPTTGTLGLVLLLVLLAGAGVVVLRRL